MKSRTVLLVAVFIIAGMVANAQIKPTFNPAKGEKYTYRLTTDQKSLISAGGQEMAVSTYTEMLTEMNIKEKNNNEITLEFFYREIVMTVSNPMMNFKIDTKNKAGHTSDVEKNGANIFDCIVGKPLQLVINPDGTIKSITGYDAIIDDMKKITSALSAMEQQMSNMFTQSFNEETMKTTFEQTYKIYPDKEIKVGDSWSIDYEYTIMGMSNNVKKTFTLKSVTNDIALLGLTTVSTMKGGAGMEGEMKGEQKGEIKLNIKTGMSVQSTSEDNSKGKFSAQGMETSMDITSKATSVLVP